MPAAPDDFSAFHQHGADHRIRRSRAIAAPGEPEGEAHMMQFAFREDVRAPKLLNSTGRLIFFKD
jgi:hypothetical protein